MVVPSGEESLYTMVHPSPPTIPLAVKEEAEANLECSVHVSST